MIRLSYSQISHSEIKCHICKSVNEAWLKTTKPHPTLAVMQKEAAGAFLKSKQKIPSPLQTEMHCAQYTHGQLL